MKLPHLHLRDLFWLVLILCIGCGGGRDGVQSVHVVNGVEITAHHGESPVETTHELRGDVELWRTSEMSYGLDDGYVVVDGIFYGEVKTGDHVEIRAGQRAYKRVWVNGHLRRPQKGPGP